MMPGRHLLMAASLSPHNNSDSLTAMTGAINATTDPFSLVTF